MAQLTPEHAQKETGKIKFAKCLTREQYLIDYIYHETISLKYLRYTYSLICITNGSKYLSGSAGDKVFESYV
jgi:hypothetical protein